MVTELRAAVESWTARVAVEPALVEDGPQEEGRQQEGRRLIWDILNLYLRDT